MKKHSFAFVIVRPLGSALAAPNFICITRYTVLRRWSQAIIAIWPCPWSDFSKKNYVVQMHIKYILDFVGTWSFILSTLFPRMQTAKILGEVTALKSVRVMGINQCAHVWWGSVVEVDIPVCKLSQEYYQVHVQGVKDIKKWTRNARLPGCSSAVEYSEYSIVIQYSSTPVVQYEFFCSTAIVLQYSSTTLHSGLRATTSRTQMWCNVQ